MPTSFGHVLEQFCPVQTNTVRSLDSLLSSEVVFPRASANEMCPAGAEPAVARTYAENSFTKILHHNLSAKLSQAPKKKSRCLLNFDYESVRAANEAGNEKSRYLRLCAHSYAARKIVAKIARHFNIASPGD